MDKNVEYCIQHNLRKNSADQSVISSNLDNVWRKYDISALTDDFMKWGCSERYYYYEQNLNPDPIPDECPKPPVRKNGGIHQGTVATYGKWLGRGDSGFHLNNTVKGTALCPTLETINEVLPILEQLKRDFPNADERLPQYYEIMQGVFSHQQL